jgi:hypothetical protein
MRRVGHAVMRRACARRAACAAAVLALASLSAAQAAPGEACHYECRDGTTTCSADLVQVCHPVRVFGTVAGTSGPASTTADADAEMDAYVQSLGLAGKAWGEANARLLALDFHCAHVSRGPGTELQCGRAVSMPRCMLQLQNVQVTLKETDPGYRPADPEAMPGDWSERPHYDALPVAKAAGHLAASGDDECRGGK